MKLSVVVSISFLVTVIEAANILVSAPFGSKSHQNTFIPLIEALSAHGHSVTYITNYGSSKLKENKNIKLIVVDKLAIDASKYPNVFNTARDEEGEKASKMLLLQNMFTFPVTVAEETYQHPQVQDILKHDTYDLVLISQAFSVTSYPFTWYYKAPFIIISPNVMFPGSAELMGDSTHPEYVPFIFTDYSDQMNFKQRIANTFMTSFFDILLNQWPRSGVENVIHKSIPGCPSLDEIEKNVSLYFTNTHPAFTYPRVLPLDVIEIGAIHCRPAKLLPKDLEGFISKSESGFVVFAVGTAVNMNDMPDDMMQAFISVFSRIPQHVIWQWKGTRKENLPDNIMTVDWLPQQDLLGHSSCRLFLSHGGLNSIQEAIYHGVPVLGLPFAMDQKLNLGRAVRDGYALQLEWKDLNNESLHQAIHTLLNVPKYMNQAKKLSSILRDQLETPLERAVYWVEYVIRHNGTRHLRLASRDLAPYQRALIDVYAVLLLAFALPALFVCWCIRRWCIKRSSVGGKQVPIAALKKNQ